MCSTLDFTVTEVEATIPEGLSVEIQGRRFDSGPVRVAMDDTAPLGSSHGSLDYDANVAHARFLVRLDFPVLRYTLRAAGLDDALAPVRAEIVSRGAILSDHSFAFRGSCHLSSHDFFRAGTLEAEVLAGT